MAAGETFHRLTPTSAMNEPTAINPAAIERLLKLGGQKFAVEMIELFGSYGGTKLAEARAACAAGQFLTMAEATHPLKSSAGNVGAVRVQALAAQTEHAAREKQPEAAGAGLARLEQAFAEAVSALQAVKNKLNQPPA